MSLNLSSIINFDSFFAQRSEWKRFGNTIFFLIGVPLLLFFGMLETICWRTGENIPLTQAARLQVNNPHLVFMRIQDANQAAFKLIRISQERPEVLALGQSRGGQFRSAMFRPYSFYNYARLAWTFKGYSNLVRQLPADYNPKVIIFNLDFYTFNPENTSVYAPSDQQSHLPVWQNHVNALRETLAMFYTHPWLILAGRRNAHDGEPSIGIKPALFGHGFRYDGSETQSIKSYQAAGEDPHLLSGFQPNSNPLFYGDRMGSQEIADFEEFVRLAHARRAILIGVQMPIYEPVLREMEKNPHYGILNDFRDHLSEGYFDRLDVIAFDEADLPPFSEDYHYFIDTLHATEPVSAAVLLKMDEDPRVKAALPLLDTAAIRKKLEEDRNASQHIDLYRYEF